MDETNPLAPPDIPAEVRPWLQLAWDQANIAIAERVTAVREEAQQAFNGIQAEHESRLLQVQESAAAAHEKKLASMTTAHEKKLAVDRVEQQKAFHNIMDEGRRREAALLEKINELSARLTSVVHLSVPPTPAPTSVALDTTDPVLSQGSAPSGPMAIDSETSESSTTVPLPSLPPPPSTPAQPSTPAPSSAPAHTCPRSSPSAIPSAAPQISEPAPQPSATAPQPSATAPQPSTPSAQPSSGQKRARVRTTAPPGRVHKPKKSKSKKGPPVKPSTHIHRMMKSDAPADIGGLIKAFHFHVKMMLQMDATDVPPVPLDAALVAFNKRFTTRAEVLALMATAADVPPAIDPETVPLLTSHRVPGSASTSTFTMEDHILDYIRAFCAGYGMAPWCPDLRQSPYSNWNSSCRIIALATFKQAVVACAYTYFAPNTTYLSNTRLLVRIYDHFVHHYQKKRFRKELATPGSVVTAEANNKMYQNRLRLSEARHEFAKDYHYPRRIRDLVSDPKATSDDEWLPDGTFQVNSKPGRSAAFNNFIVQFDEERQKLRRLEPGRGYKERVRVRVAQPKLSPFPKLPKGMPYDYYDPDFFNALPSKIKRKISKHQVALPLDIKEVFHRPRASSQKMKDVEFMEKYGPDALKIYRAPKDDDSEDEESSESDGGNEGDELPDVMDIDQPLGDEEERQAFVRDFHD